MADFKVGDRVQVIGNVLPYDDPYDDFVGSTGTVVDSEPSDDYGTRYTVTLDNTAGIQVCFYTKEVEKID